MRKILLAFDGVHFSEGAFEFARQLNEKNPIFLTGTFLPQVNYANLWSYADGIGGPLFIPVQDDSEIEKIEENIRKFQSMCQKHSIEYTVRKDFSDLALPALKKESRFADLLILGSETFYQHVGSGDPNNYIKEVLHDVECAVIIIPEKFEFPILNILAYDGTNSSVFAIKQFVYLLPEFLDNRTLLIYANEEITHDIPNEPHIEELVSRHFNDLTVTKLNLDPKDRFANWLNKKKAAILICGSFSRSTFSEIFNKSFISEIIKAHKFHVFIAHK